MVFHVFVGNVNLLGLDFFLAERPNHEMYLFYKGFDVFWGVRNGVGFFWQPIGTGSGNTSPFHVICGPKSAGTS